jgi:hypothetical protein
LWRKEKQVGMSVFSMEMEGYDGGGGRFSVDTELLGAAAREEDTVSRGGYLTLTIAAVEAERWAEISPGDMDWCDVLFGARHASERDYLRPWFLKGEERGVRAVLELVLSVPADGVLHEVSRSGVVDVLAESELRWIGCVTHSGLGLDSMKWDAYVKLRRTGGGGERRQRSGRMAVQMR